MQFSQQWRLWRTADVRWPERPLEWRLQYQMIYHFLKEALSAAVVRGAYFAISAAVNFSTTLNVAQ